MSGNTTIGWTQRVWNPVVGCTPVSPGCDHCYAATLHEKRHAIAKRNNGQWSEGGSRMPRQYDLPFATIQLLPERLEQPLHIRQPSLIFVDSVSDLFHSQVHDAFIQQIFAVMQQASWHTFQILTKRVGRLRRLGQHLPWPENVWIGVSIEDDRFTRRADALRAVPAAIRFLSCEPLLGPLPSLDLTNIDWVIAGGESGVGYRPMHLDWVRDLRDRCLEAQISFFFKQHNGLRPGNNNILDGQYWEQFPFRQEHAQ